MQKQKLIVFQCLSILSKTLLVGDISKILHTIGGNVIMHFCKRYACNSQEHVPGTSPARSSRRRVSQCELLHRKAFWGKGFTSYVPQWINRFFNLKGMVMAGWVVGSLKPLMMADLTCNRWICKGAKIRERGTSQFTVDCFGWGSCLICLWALAYFLFELARLPTVIWVWPGQTSWLVPVLFCSC